MALPRNKLLTVIVVIILLALLGSVVMSMAGKKMGEAVVEGMMERATGDEADVDMKGDGTMEITTDEGTFTTGNDVPKDWPEDAPIYTNATVQYAATANENAGTQGSALMLETKDSVAEVTAFYEAELVANGWKVDNTMKGGGSVLLLGTKENRTFSIAISSAGDSTSIAMGVETK